MARKRMKLGTFVGGKEFWQPKFQMADHAADGDIRLAHLVVEKLRIATIMFKLLQRGLDLRRQARIKVLADMARFMKRALEKQRNNFI